ncbi:hypothetical protein PENSPDRAFT_553930, partial [Peniophora sp. CONT]
VIGPVGLKTQHRLRDGSRESLTFMPTICANGTVSLRPTLIFRGSRFQHKWAEHNSLDCAIAISPKGSIDDELAHQWMTRFELATRPRDPSEWRALYLDSHTCHISLWMIDFAEQHRIEMIGYVPHSTQWLQGLDVVLFGAFKEKLMVARNDWERAYDCFDKIALLEILKGVFEASFTRDNILAAFRSTGISPFNPSVIPSRATAASEETSYGAIFPL